MTEADVAVREVATLRAAAEARICAESAAELVRDASGGDPIVYDDEQEGPDGGGFHRQRA